MKTSVILKSVTAIAFVAIIVACVCQPSWSYTGGSPNGCTGSPADKQTCAREDCHKGTVLFRDGLVKSNIPASGYIPGATYVMTATAVGSTSARRFGFQISPQSITGQLLGTMTITNPAETKLTGKGKYITQKDMGVEGRAYKSWSFNWTAPKAGTGKVVFYGCFVIGGRNEAVLTSTLSVNEKV